MDPRPRDLGSVLCSKDSTQNKDKHAGVLLVFVLISLQQAVGTIRERYFGAKERELQNEGDG